MHSKYTIHSEVPNVKAYEVQTWYTDGATKTRISDKRRDLQGQR